MRDEERHEDLIRLLQTIIEGQTYIMSAQDDLAAAVATLNGVANSLATDVAALHAVPVLDTAPLVAAVANVAAAAASVTALVPVAG